ncbi:hypothetical protein WMF37_03635 [Sorangium sp. So ce291]|uniref:hypothetical protein n=1 Tax=Sorangium sp. So ce291 TaxID=3133294 RepID=UPI003F5F65CC
MPDPCARSALRSGGVPTPLFAQYRTVPSLEEYMLASQKAPRIEVFTRQPDGAWLLRIHGPGERAELSSLGCALDVDRVYLDAFEQSAAGDGPPAAP